MCFLLLLRQLLSTHRHSVQGFITSLATTMLQKGLVFVFLNRNDRCFLKQKTLRCFSAGNFIMPFWAFSSLRKLVFIHHSVYSLLIKKGWNYCRKQELFTTHTYNVNNYVCGCVHVCKWVHAFSSVSVCVTDFNNSHSNKSSCQNNKIGCLPVPFKTTHNFLFVSDLPPLWLRSL